MPGPPGYWNDDYCDWNDERVRQADYPAYHALGFDQPILQCLALKHEDL